MEKVIFDTDIGSDIDDALALAYLLKEPRCELLGVTTVTSYPELRASMVSAICRNAGRGEVPIHVGCPQSLLIDVPQRNAEQAKAIGAWDHAEFERRNTAIDFLYRTIMANPGEVTLLAVGPMTNVAVLFATHPDVAAKLKKLVLMCGKFEKGGGPEWNALNDPHATAITYGRGFQSRPPLHCSCGLDVTTKCTLHRDEGREKFKQYPVLGPVSDFAEVWFAKRELATFHDPLAAVCVFEPDVCKWRDVRVEVSTLAPTLGYTVPLYHTEDKPHKIGESVDSARFFDIYFSTIGK
jgi:inosine-uridine nucleoside N-ribohydrolase